LLYGSPPGGTGTRTLHTHGGQEVRLARRDGTCPSCGVGLFPLDDKLVLLSGSLTPRLQANLVQLSTHIPSVLESALPEELLAEFSLNREALESLAREGLLVRPRRRDEGKMPSLPGEL